MLWIDRLDQVEAGRGLAEAVAWLVAREIAERSAARAAPEDLADAAPLGPAQGAARLLRRRLLRALAARLVDCPPEIVRFERSEEGGVRLLAPAGAFASVAGRVGWSVVALGPRPIGVDVEAAEPAPPLPLDLLHPEEQANLAALAPAEQARAFARLWVAKEAYAKASGQPLEAVLAAQFSLCPSYCAKSKFLAGAVEA